MPSADPGVVSMTFAGLRIATFHDAPYRSKSARKPKSVSPKPTLSLSRRRSVSSMKGLLPLTLSPSSSSATWSSFPADENMGGRVDDYFPEILAHDLALSAELFAAKDMTAGAPASSLSFDDKAKAKHTPGHSKITFSSPYHATSARVQSLGAIEERDSMVSCFDQRETKSDAASDELDSFSGTETSGDMAPPSFRFRNHSVVTAATSLASEGWKPSLKYSPPPEDTIQSSWIDNDSDGEGEDGIREYGLASLSPRPPTPPESDEDHGLVLKKIDSSGSENCRVAPLHKKSHSVSGASPIPLPRRQISARSVRDVFKSPSVINNTQVMQERKSRSHLPTTRTLEECPSESAYARAHTRHQSARLPDWPAKKQRGAFVAAAEPSPVSDEFPEADDESLPPLQSPSRDRTNTVYIRPSPPPSPLPSVQAWLNGSLQPYSNPYQQDDLAKVVPLPPNVIETLRVSIACFPETMLLCSSLSVETIRAYAKKVRHPDTDLFKALPPVSPTQTTRKSIWRKVVSSKRSSQTLDQRPRQLRSSNGNKLQSSSSTSLDAPKPWVPLKNVFGCCSDYICDALYAHIVTYNYISALVARCPPAPRTKKPHANGHSGAQNEDIPKKAATLLGLGGSPDQTLAGVNRFAKRISTPFGNWAKEEMVAAQSPGAANQDNAVRNIQAGLLRCISRLTATAKLMAESGSGEDRMVEMDAEDTDMLLMRSLCEIVRMSEETN